MKLFVPGPTVSPAMVAKHVTKIAMVAGTGRYLGLKPASVFEALWDSVFILCSGSFYASLH